MFFLKHGVLIVVIHILLATFCLLFLLNLDDDYDDYDDDDDDDDDDD